MRRVQIPTGRGFLNKNLSEKRNVGSLIDRKKFAGTDILDFRDKSAYIPVCSDLRTLRCCQSQGRAGFFADKSCPECEKSGLGPLKYFFRVLGAKPVFKRLRIKIEIQKVAHIFFKNICPKRKKTGH